MANFFTAKLGASSEVTIRAIDALHGSPPTPFLFDIPCSQVTLDLAVGDFLFIGFGSNNSKGGATDWVRGVRALGTVTAKSGGPKYADPWVISVELRVVLPESVTSKDLLNVDPMAYAKFSGLPVVGLGMNAQQTIQMVDSTQPDEVVPAFFNSLSAIHPSFRSDTLAAYPALAPYFVYVSPGVTGTVGGAPPPLPAAVPVDLAEIVERFKADADAAELRIDPAEAHRFLASLLSKRFLIASGLAGSGKTKLAQAFAQWLTPVASAVDPFTPGSTFESNRLKYVVDKSNSLGVEFWKLKDPALAAGAADATDEEAETEAEKGAPKSMVPREVIEEWASFIEENGLPEGTSANVISEGVEKTSQFSPYLHRFRPFLKAAAFALVKARAGKVAVKRYEVVPVGADWTGNENILGYANGLDAASYISKPALDLMLLARDNPTVPHILILDEMNLSHVERYFADVLSVIESDERINLHRDADRKSDGVQVPKAIGLPKNLFIIGTVNVDETTYMFSPKVLDRASVIEFRMNAGELAIFLGNPSKPDLSTISGKGAAFGQAFVDGASLQVPNFAEPLKGQYEAEMLLFFNALRGNGAEFGYRVAHEAARFIHFYRLLGGHADADPAWFAKAFDCLVAQKFLPKLHGSRAKLGPLLKKLWFLCVADAVARGADALAAAEVAAKSTEKTAEPSLIVPDGAPYAVSAEKIGRMWRLLNDNGFASFAEA